MVRKIVQDLAREWGTITHSTVAPPPRIFSTVAIAHLAQSASRARRVPCCYTAKVYSTRCSQHAQVQRVRNREAGARNTHPALRSPCSRHASACPSARWKLASRAPAVYQIIAYKVARGGSGAFGSHVIKLHVPFFENEDSSAWNCLIQKPWGNKSCPHLASAFKIAAADAQHGTQPDPLSPFPSAPVVADTPKPAGGARLNRRMA